MNRYVKSATSLSIFFIACSPSAYAQGPAIGAPPEASNMKLVGSNDLQARSAYQPTIHHQGDRWIAYIGHHGGTDHLPPPGHPQTRKPGPHGTPPVDVPPPGLPVC